MRNLISISGELRATFHARIFKPNVFISATNDQYNGRPLAISRAKCWYGRLLITLHEHYGRSFCLINLNISSFIIVAKFLTKSVIFNTICKPQRFRLLDNHRIWLRPDPHNNNNNVISLREIFYIVTE